MLTKNNITIDFLKKSCQRWNYAFFENGDYNLNIIGIRKYPGTVNKFDDFMTLSYKVNGNWILKVYNCSTDPGTYWLNNLMNVDGTAILVPYQYRGSHQIGLHKGQYEALTQKGPIAVYRDKNKDSKHDCDPRTIQSGIFGVNIHRSSPTGTSTQVDKWSAGCQVIDNITDYNEFMSICKKAREKWGNSFTYTLFDERQLVL